MLEREVKYKYAEVDTYGSQCVSPRISFYCSILISNTWAAPEYLPFTFRAVCYCPVLHNSSCCFHLDNSEIRVHMDARCEPNQESNLGSYPSILCSLNLRTL